VPLRRERAFVLSAVALRERDRIVTYLGEESGKRRGVARGARRLRGASMGAFEPMTEVDLVCFEKEGRDLCRIDSASVVRSSFPLADDLPRALLLSAMAESLSTFASDSDPAEKLYRLAGHALDALFAGEDPKKVSAYFDIWILRLSGVFPPLSECAACGGPTDRGEGVLLFDESLPGFLCPACARPGVRRLSKDFPRAIGEALSRRIGEVELLPRRLAEVSDVTARIRRHFLGHELRSRRVLTEIW
jgi:DNA repair protein RecO